MEKRRTVPARRERPRSRGDNRAGPVEAQPLACLVARSHFETRRFGPEDRAFILVYGKRLSGTRRGKHSGFLCFQFLARLRLSMPHDIIDNRELHLADAVRPLLSESVCAHFSVAGSSDLSLAGLWVNTELGFVVHRNGNHEQLLKRFNRLWDDGETSQLGSVKSDVEDALDVLRNTP